MQQRFDQDTIDFIQSSEVALHLASCDAQRRSHSTQAFGCRIAADGLTMITWVAINGFANLLASINSSGRLALVVCHVESFQSLQFKAVDARVLPMDSTDYPRVLAYQQGFVCKTAALGYRQDVMRTHVQFRVDQLAAVQFTPHTAFVQTPGPNAGAAIAASR